MTALHDTLAANSAHVAEFSGTSTAADFGDVRGEFQALLTTCGVYDLGWRAKITLTGGDRVRWLNGMVTSNVRDLTVGHGVYGFVLSPQGHIQGDLYAYHQGDSLLLDTDRSQREVLLKIFDHYIIMDDVEVRDASEELTAIGIAGPNSTGLLRELGQDVAILQPLQFTENTWQGTAVRIVRGDSPAIENFEVWLAPALVTAFWQGLVAKGARPVGTAAVELLRMACGLPRYGVDIRERDLPQETEQQRALNFSKGCYIGQEIVERIRSRGNVHRKFSGFEVRGPLPAAGTKIQNDGKDIGEITSAAVLTLASQDLPVALGYMRREVANPGSQFAAGESTLTVSKLPFPEVFTEK
jgi:folate-binding protein YgfZ